MQTEMTRREVRGSSCCQGVNGERSNKISTEHAFYISLKRKEITINMEVQTIKVQIVHMNTQNVPMGGSVKFWGSSPLAHPVAPSLYVCSLMLQITHTHLLLYQSTSASYCR